MAPLSVTPSKLCEMCIRLVDATEQKQQLEDLMRRFAAGQVDRAGMTDAVAAIAGNETLMKALRIMVPGFDEMRGAPAPAPAPAAPPPPTTTASTEGLSKMKKGFLSGGKRLGAPAAAAAPPAVAPPAAPARPRLSRELLEGLQAECMADDLPIEDEMHAWSEAQARAYFESGGVDRPPPQPQPPPPPPGELDPISLRESIYAQKHHQMPTMDPHSREHIMHNDFLMHDARHAGNQGNVVLDANGRAVVKSDDAMGGAADGYTWGQNEAEVTLKVPGPAGMRARDVLMKAASLSLRLEVCGRLVVDGRLHASILPDESTFSLEDAADGRLLVVTLAKAAKTSAKGHWPSVVAGGPAIDTQKFGAAVVAANPDNPRELIEAFRQLKGNG